MQHLTQLKQHIATKLPRINQDKSHLFIVNGDYQNGYLTYTARFLFLDCRGDPIEILAVIKHWLKAHNLHKDQNGNDIQISFSSEVIDQFTFDLEIDFPQREKINLTVYNYTSCPPLKWDDQRGFVPDVVQP